MLIFMEFCIDIGTFGLVFMSQRQRQKCKLLNGFFFGTVFILVLVLTQNMISLELQVPFLSRQDIKYSSKKNQSTTLICAIS